MIILELILQVSRSKTEKNEDSEIDAILVAAEEEKGEQNESNFVNNCTDHKNSSGFVDLSDVQDEEIEYDPLQVLHLQFVHAAQGPVPCEYEFLRTVSCIFSKVNTSSVSHICAVVIRASQQNLVNYRFPSAGATPTCRTARLSLS